MSYTRAGYDRQQGRMERNYDKLQKTMEAKGWHASQFAATGQVKGETLYREPITGEWFGLLDALAVQRFKEALRETAGRKRNGG